MSDNPSLSNLEKKENKERLVKTTEGTDTLVDIEKGVFITLGVPEKDKIIFIPEKPHVFIAGELHVKDKNHPQSEIFKEVAVLMAHGHRSEGDVWVFNNGQDVPETVNAYNAYAKKENLPQVEFLIVCNEDKVTQETGVFIHEPQIPTKTAYAAGEKLVVNTVLEEDGTNKIYVTAEENVINLESLQVRILGDQG